MAKTGDQRAALAVLIDITGQLNLTLGLAGTGPNVPNQLAKYKIDATDFGTRRADIEASGFTIPLDRDPMLGKLPGAKQVTITLRGTMYVFDVSGGDQVLSILKSCLTAPLTVDGNGSRGYKADTPASVITLTCTFKPARGTPDSVSEQPIDISFDEANNRILNREVVLGPKFTESNIRWREPTNDNHFVDYELDRHSGAARIYFGGLKDNSEPLASVGMCQLAPKRRF
jgi:hypothetical protein